jgi:hypothetical protein
MLKEASQFLEKEKKPLNFSIPKRFFPQTKFSEVSYEDLPAEAVRIFEGYSRRFILPEDYKEKNFSYLIKAQHDENDFTYIASQTKKFTRTNLEVETDTYFVDILDGEYVGRSELRYAPKSNIGFFKKRPFIGYIITEENLRDAGLGTRRVYQMNAISQMFFNLPLYSDTLISSKMCGLWENLVKEGKASKFKQDKANRFLFTDQEPKDFTHTVILSKKEIEDIDKRVDDFFEKVEIGSGEFVSFPEVCWNLLDKQSQYGSYYVTGLCDRPNLGNGLRFLNRDKDYHDIRIHSEDIGRFLKRYERYKKGVISGKVYTG